MQHTQQIFESLFERDFSDSSNSSFLVEITEKHPYFSPAQFFLLQKTKADTDAFERQAVKTNLFFNNPHWLNFQLIQTETTVEEVELVQEMEAVQDTPVIESVDIKAAEPVLEPVDDLPDNTEEAESIETEIEPMHIELKMTEEKADLDEGMLFEPMHLVDYFASQGIKLSEEVQTADKLGKQLKSFTEWLKTMKKVHVENEAAATGETDGAIQSLAESSNAQAEILTESMAEIFARQGKTGKAGELYQKLSLLNPAKSAYFAAKIENLKGI
jgi:hypothetical protein